MTPENVRLELDDIQSGVLRPCPTPYVATYIVLRIDNRAAGRELMRRVSTIVTPARTRTPAAAQTSVPAPASLPPAPSQSTYEATTPTVPVLSGPAGA